jgi:hypothetical protein
MVSDFMLHNFLKSLYGLTLHIIFKTAAPNPLSLGYVLSSLSLNEVPWWRPSAEKAHGPVIPPWLDSSPDCIRKAGVQRSCSNKKRAKWEGNFIDDRQLPYLLVCRSVAVPYVNDSFESTNTGAAHSTAGILFDARHFLTSE